MNIYRYLKQDHQTVSNLFDQILEITNTNKRDVLIETLKTELLLHVDIEYAEEGNNEITEYFVKITAPSPNNENSQPPSDRDVQLFLKGA